MSKKYEQKKLIERAAIELSNMIDRKNADLKKNIKISDVTDPDYLDKQTCQELMVLAKEL